MKSINKYVTMGLILNFISCDLLMNDEIKDKSLGLLDKVHSVLYAKVDSIKDKKTTNKKKRVIKKKRPSAVVASQEAIVSGNNDVVVAQQDVKNDVLLDKESTRVTLSGTNLGLQNINRVQETSGNSINRSVQSSSTGVTTITFNNNSRVSTPISRSVFVEPKKDDNIIVQSNLINFDLDFNSHQSQIISGSNLEEIEEEEDYYFQEGEVIEEEENSYYGLVNSDARRHNAYVEGVRYNVGKAIELLNQMDNDYGILRDYKLTIHSTRFDDDKRVKDKVEASKFTKEKVNRDLKALLDYVKAGAKVAKNLVSGKVYIQSASETNKKLDAIEKRLATLIADVKNQYDAYEAYKAIERSKIYEVKESLNFVKGYVVAK